MYNGPRHYIFSGNMTTSMVDKLLAAPQFEPIDVLVSQLDRSGVAKTLQFFDRGAIKSLFIDSGAYTVHSQGFDYVAKVLKNKAPVDSMQGLVDNYIDFVNELDDKIIAVAQFDHIPGVFRQPKTPQDYVESTEKSWENFLYMYPKMKSPEKLIAVMHQGESFDYLGKLIEWKDANGNQMPYIGISPSNDRGVSEKDIYLKEVYDYISKSSNPDVKTHLFGYTSLPGLPKFPWYSVDSTSHRQRSAYSKVFIGEWGTISLSRTRSTSTKSDQCFTEIADKEHVDRLREIVEGYGLTMEQVINDNAARVVVDILEIQKYLREHPYHPQNLVRQKKLFCIQ